MRTEKKRVERTKHAGLGDQKKVGAFIGRGIEGRECRGKRGPSWDVLRGRGLQSLPGDTGRQGWSPGERAGLDAWVKESLAWECQVGSWRSEGLREGKEEVRVPRSTCVEGKGLARRGSQGDQHGAVGEGGEGPGFPLQPSERVRYQVDSGMLSAPMALLQRVHI